ncbi:MAG: cytidine deaminase [Oscillospiraceae bacterium]|nr:cytidine deaminase [Oscillospiraceae bacterium]
MKYYTISEEDRELIRRGIETIRMCYDPVRKHHQVGAALRCKSGNIYTGVNCSGIHGACAEYIVMGAAVTAGEKEFDTIVAVRETAPNSLYAPCGNCRQMLFEYCPDIKVILNDAQGNIVKVTAADLLPFAWTAVDE